MSLFEAEGIVNAVSGQIAKSAITHDQETTSSTHLLRSSSSRSSSSKLKNDVRTSYNAINGEHSETDSEDDDDTIDEEEDVNPLKYEFQHLSWKQRPSYKLLLVAIVIHVVGLMASMTSIIDAIVFLICQNYFKTSQPPNQLPGFPGISPVTPSPLSGDSLSFNDPRCSAPEIMALVGVFQTYLTTISAVISVISVPLMSSCSDRWGRRPVLLWAMSFNIMTKLIMIACCSRPDLFSYHWLLATAVMDGLGGVPTLLVLLSSSYISDSIKENFRASIISILDACVFGGLALGPIVGATILTYTDNDIVKLFSFSLSTDIIFIIIVVCFLAESRSEKSRRRAMGEHLARRKSFLAEQRSRRNSLVSFSSIEPSSRFWSKQVWSEKLRELAHVANIFHPLKVLRFAYITEIRVKINIYILIIAQAVLSDVLVSATPFILLYAKTKFNFTSVENGYFISTIGGCRFIFLSLGLPTVLRSARSRWTHYTSRIDLIDKRVIQIGLLFSATGVFVMAEAPTSTIFMLSCVILAMGSGSSPMIRNAIIKHAPKNKVGEVLGATNVIGKGLGIISPAIFSTIYSLTVGHRAQTVVECMAGVEYLLFGVVSLLCIQNLPTDSYMDI